MAGWSPLLWVRSRSCNGTTLHRLFSQHQGASCWDARPNAGVWIWQSRAPHSPVAILSPLTPLWPLPPWNTFPYLHSSLHCGSSSMVPVGCNRHWLVWLSIGWHWAGIGLVISTLGVLHDTFEILSTGGGYCWVSGIGPYSLKNLWRVTIVRFKKERDKMYGGYSHSRLK